MRKLYHYWVCPFSRKIRILLAEKKLSFESVVIKPWEVPASFLGLNPEGLPPVLTDDDGKNIANAYPIAEYLNEVYFEPSLLGETSAQRAEVRRLVACVSRCLYSTVASHVRIVPGKLYVPSRR